MALKIVVPPQQEPLTLTETKLHLKVEESETVEDTLINGLIIAAREYCEEVQNRAYIQQTIELVRDDWPRCEIILPRPPIISIEYVKYYGTDDTEYTWNSQLYIADTDSEPGRIAPAYSQTFPTLTLRPINGVKVRYIAGSTPGEEDSDGNIDYAVNVPQKVKLAMLLLIGYWYGNREAAQVNYVSKEVDFSVRALLKGNRVWPV